MPTEHPEHRPPAATGPEPAPATLHPGRPKRRRASAAVAEPELEFIIDQTVPPGNVVRALAALLLAVAERERAESKREA